LDDCYLSYQNTDGAEGKLVFQDPHELLNCVKTLKSAFARGQGFWWGLEAEDDPGYLDRMLYFPPNILYFVHFGRLWEKDVLDDPR
jgi:hypothetical protein